MVQIFKFIIVFFSIFIIKYNNETYEPSYYVNLSSYVIIIFLIIDMFISYIKENTTDMKYPNYSIRQSNAFNTTNNTTFYNYPKFVSKSDIVKKVKKQITFKTNIKEILNVEKTNNYTENIQLIYSIILSAIEKTSYQTMDIQSKILFIQIENNVINITIRKDFPEDVIELLSKAIESKMKMQIKFNKQVNFQTFLKTQIIKNDSH